jgi:hypothetical protein
MLPLEANFRAGGAGGVKEEEEEEEEEAPLEPAMRCCC